MTKPFTEAELSDILFDIHEQARTEGVDVASIIAEQPQLQCFSGADEAGASLLRYLVRRAVEAEVTAREGHASTSPHALH
jgi:hypothetical protein